MGFGRGTRRRNKRWCCCGSRQWFPLHKRRTRRLGEPADVGAEVAGVAGAALAGDPKPSAIGAIGSPLQMVAGGPDAGREELGGTAAAAREGAVGVDPHVELDLIISR